MASHLFRHQHDPIPTGRPHFFVKGNVVDKLF
jgi:hypothetical protein